MENIASLKHRIVKKKQTSPTPTPQGLEVDLISAQEAREAKSEPVHHNSGKTLLEKRPRDEGKTLCKKIEVTKTTIPKKS